MNQRHRPLIIGLVLIAIGWSLSIWGLLHLWQGEALRLNREHLESQADLAKSHLSAPLANPFAHTFPGGGIVLGVFDSSDRMLPRGDSAALRYAPELGSPSLVAERDLPEGRIVRLSWAIRGGGIPKSAWTLASIAASLGLLFPALIYAGFVYRERQRIRHLDQVAKAASAGHGIHATLPDEDAQLVATLAMDLRRRRILSSWGERRLGRLLDSLSEGVLLLDGRQRIFACNTSACRTLRMGVPKAAARGRPAVSVVGDIEFLDDLRRALSRSGPSVFSIERDGAAHEARVWPASVDSDGNGWMVSLQDVTDKLRAERMKSRLISDASHEFKTPLTSIRGWTETLLDDESDEFRRKALQRIEQGTLHLENVVRDLLDLGRVNELPARRREEIDLEGACQEAIETLAAQAFSKRIRIALDCADHARVSGHRNQLVRALINLLSNAVRHSPPSTTVEVRVLKDATAWRIEVSDQGSGVPAESIAHLFERFYRADHGRSRDMGGTGLGLAIVKETAQAHGGFAEVESPPGQGATFRIVLPT
ncbi:MAG: hypothetical protein IPK50_15405 [Fibrobacterota bacterium]|nr:hypothetical protein [Fibrobacterota bacterium]QQS03679.1 MAG: hypothetical protein IPK50_15405 [Fibrobacterota bacterium]